MTGFTLLVNRYAGGGAGPAAAEEVAARLRDARHRVELVPTEDVAGARALVEAAVARDDVVVSVGGDGMLASVAGAVSELGGVLGIVPAGRGNDFARVLGLPAGPAAAAERLTAGTPTRVGLIRVTLPGAEPRVVAGSAYAGLDAQAGLIVEGVRWMPVPLQYPYAAVRAIAGFRPSHFTVDVDGERLELDGSSVVVANSAYYGSGMRIAPGAVVDDGLLEVVAIGAGSRRRLLRCLPKVYDGEHVELPEVRVLRGRRIELTASPSTPLGGDGEALGRLPALGDEPAVVEVLPGVLRVLV